MMVTKKMRIQDIPAMGIGDSVTIRKYPEGISIGFPPKYVVDGQIKKEINPRAEVFVCPLNTAYNVSMQWHIHNGNFWIAVIPESEEVEVNIDEKYCK